MIGILLVGSLGACSFGYETLTETGEQRTSPDGCGSCHVEIYEEWRASAHATAWSGRDYASVTADHGLESCAPCHAPDSVFEEPAIRARDVRPHEGVDCVACHLDGGALVGPLESSAMLQPHPIREGLALYREADLCGRCHVGTFTQWKSAPDHERDGRAKRTCQECHMPQIVRTVTQGTGTLSKILVSAEAPHAQRRHRFDLGAVGGFEGVADLALAVEDGRLIVTVVNNLPHALPTGDYGPRTIVATLAFDDAAGRRIGALVLTWSARLDTAIPPLATDRREVPVPPGAASVLVVLERPERSGLVRMELATARGDLP